MHEPKDFFPRAVSSHRALSLFLLLTPLLLFCYRPWPSLRIFSPSKLFSTVYRIFGIYQKDEVMPAEIQPLWRHPAQQLDAVHDLREAKYHAIQDSIEKEGKKSPTAT